MYAHFIQYAYRVYEVYATIEMRFWGMAPHLLRPKRGRSSPAEANMILKSAVQGICSFLQSAKRGRRFDHAPTRPEGRARHSAGISTEPSMKCRTEANTR